jgi:FMN phosphatase YigB (HAD superfamily)
MNARVVFIDWHNTLSTSLFWQHRPGCRLSASDSARVGSFVFSRGELVQQWMRGAMAAEDVCILAARRLGLRAEDLLADLEHNCRAMKFHDAACVGAIAAMRAQRIRVVVATDNMDVFSRWTVPALHLGGIFDAILNSASLGVLKSDLADGQSRFFGPWLADRRIAPSETILVDDSPPASAAAIGLQTRLVEHPDQLVSILAQLALDPPANATVATTA